MSTLEAINDHIKELLKREMTPEKQAQLSGEFNNLIRALKADVKNDADIDGLDCESLSETKKALMAETTDAKLVKVSGIGEVVGYTSTDDEKYEPSWHFRFDSGLTVVLDAYIRHNDYGDGTEVKNHELIINGVVSYLFDEYEISSQAMQDFIESNYFIPCRFDSTVQRPSSEDIDKISEILGISK